jgi:hypothetical protein
VTARFSNAAIKSKRLDKPPIQVQGISPSYGRARCLDQHQSARSARKYFADDASASLVLTKGPSHVIEEVELRKL